MTRCDLVRTGSPVLLMMVTCLVATGCAVSPIAQWTPPQPKEAQPVSLGYAHRYAEAARDGYQRALREQVDSQVGLNSGLLGLGALAVGLAASKGVHKDVVLGTAFLGGTAYAFGQQNLTKQRLLIYQAGIDAIGCAKRAVVPLTMSDEHLKSLDASLLALDQQIGATVRAKSQVAQDLARWNSEAPDGAGASAAAQAAIGAAGTAIDNANKSSIAGRQTMLKVRQVGDQLVNAVDKIDAAVVKATLETLPDPKSVFTVIPGLAGFAGSIVPGADTAITAAVNKRRDGFAPEGKSLKGKQGQDITSLGLQLSVSIANLNAATDTLAVTLTRVNGLLPTADALGSTDALKDCGVADVALPFKATPDKVALPSGADIRTSIHVSGGVAPYIAKLQFTPTPGVTVQSPAPFEGTVSIDVTKDAKAGTYPVVVMDSSRPSKTLVVNVDVEASTPTDGAGTEGGTPAAGTTPQGKPLTGAAAVAQAITKKRQFQHVGGVELTLLRPATRRSETEITLGLRCSPKPAACIAPVDAGRTIVTAVGGDASRFLGALKISGADCICAP